MLDDDFIDQLPDNPFLAAKSICQEFYSFSYGLQKIEDLNSNYDDFLEFLGLFKAFSEEHSIIFPYPSLVEDRIKNIRLIRDFFDAAKIKLNKEVSLITVDQAKEKYSNRFSRGFVYAFSDGDLKQIQDHINELREYLKTSELFDDGHRRRLLLKLEKLQAELHKKMSNLDAIWGLVGDAGVALGKFGKDAKPFVDLINGIFKIGWRTQARAEELPSDAPPPLLNEPSQNQLEKGPSE